MQQWNDDSPIQIFIHAHPVLSYLAVLVVLPVFMVFALTITTSLIAAPISLLLGWL